MVHRIFRFDSAKSRNPPFANLKFVLFVLSHQSLSNLIAYFVIPWTKVFNVPFVYPIPTSYIQYRHLRSTLVRLNFCVWARRPFAVRNTKDFSPINLMCMSASAIHSPKYSSKSTILVPKYESHRTHKDRPGQSRNKEPYILSVVRLTCSNPLTLPLALNLQKFDAPFHTSKFKTSPIPNHRHLLKSKDTIRFTFRPSTLARLHTANLRIWHKWPNN